MRVKVGILLIVLALLAPASLAEGFDCQTFGCCWSDYIDALKDCRMSFGRTVGEETEIAQETREELLKGCITGAREMLKSCTKSVADNERNLEPEKKAIGINGGHPLVVEASPTGVPDVFEYGVHVDGSQAGPWTLFVANGLPDLPGMDAATGHARAFGTIEVDGIRVASAEALDAGQHDLRVPIVLSAGDHVIRFTLANADRGSGRAYVTAYLARE